MLKKLSFSMFGLLVAAAGAAWAADASASGTCTTVPPIDPNGTFVSNFVSNPCYSITLGAGGVGTGYGGDLNAQYDVIYFKNNPRFELIFVGYFPNARFFSISAYDKHEAAVGAIADKDIVPMTNKMVNPFRTGVKYVTNQKWAATVSFGGTEPTTVTPGCSISGVNIHNNWMDASQIHSGLSWNGDPAAATLPAHVTGPNSAGAVIVRRYYNISTGVRPSLLVRDLTTGCAVPANDALNTYRVVTTDRNTYVARWRDATQWQAHYTYSTTIQTRWCWGADPTQQPAWLRGPEWVPGGNTTALYYAAQLPDGLIVPPVSKFIRVRLRVPSFPATPCADANCTLSGNEQMRYTSISVQTTGTTLSSIMDKDMAVDPAGYVTLLYGIGAPRPSFATAANGYTWVDLTTKTDYTLLTSVAMRAIQPNASFACQAQVIPNRYQGWTPLGGLIADYGPVIDFPVASDLSVPATPFITSEGSCGVFPSTPPVSCLNFYPSSVLNP